LSKFEASGDKGPKRPQSQMSIVLTTFPFMFTTIPLNPPEGDKRICIHRIRFFPGLFRTGRVQNKQNSLQITGKSLLPGDLGAAFGKLPVKTITW
jgi:hypothetical protein